MSNVLSITFSSQPREDKGVNKSKINLSSLTKALLEIHFGLY